MPAEVATPPQLTSTTAPNKYFSSRQALAEHYKSDWHRYNLKRREANLAPVTEEEFQSRLHAALELRKKRLGNNKKNVHGKGDGHLKDKSKSKQVKQLKQETQKKKSLEDVDTHEDDKMIQDENSDDDLDAPIIDPLCSLFDNQKCTSIQKNFEYMNSKFGFFIPDIEFLDDMEGFIGYAAEKIHLGHICLYCQKGFKSGKDVQKHMIAKGHCKLRYEEGIDLDEWEVFYDFSEDNAQFLEQKQRERQNRKSKNKYENQSEIGVKDNSDDHDHDDNHDDSDDEWEDMSDRDEDDDTYTYENDEMDGYQDAISNHGFGVTALGELILPSGKVIGHRTLAKYYNQKFAPEQTSVRKTAVQAVLEDTYGFGACSDNRLTCTATTLSTNTGSISGRMLQQISKGGSGGSGKGILVANKGGGFSAISMYRYRAAVRKSQKGEAKWYRHQGKVRNNGNKFDKKGNRMMTGVSVAHAKR